jgi:hypothetical protein
VGLRAPGGIPPPSTTHGAKFGTRHLLEWLKGGHFANFPEDRQQVPYLLLMVSGCRKFRERFRSAYATLLPEHLFSHNHDTLQSASKHIDGGLWGKLTVIGVECNTRECADRPQSILYIHRMLSKNTAGLEKRCPGGCLSVGPLKLPVTAG